MAQWYEDLFQDFADKYDDESFTQGTTGEVDFFEQEIGFDRGREWGFAQSAVIPLWLEHERHQRVKRLRGSEDLIVVGAAEKYEARCRRCFEPGIPKQTELDFVKAKRVEKP